MSAEQIIAPVACGAVIGFYLIARVEMFRLIVLRCASLLRHLHA